MMDFEACLKVLSERLTAQIIVTSAGNTSELWWQMTGESERVFYLEASMSLASLFAAGIAIGRPHETVVAFNGDGAFCMNLGMLMVERQLSLPNLKHFVVSNGVYGSTNDLTLPFRQTTDYAAMGRACGIERTYEFSALPNLLDMLDEIIARPGYTFTVLNVKPLGKRVHSPQLDGPEIKFRFGRYLESRGGPRIFDVPLPARQ